MTDTNPLPARLDTASAPGLVSALNDRRGNPVVLDGSGVSHAGALGLQALIAARREWQAAGHSFRISAPSEALISACSLLGIAAQEIGITAEEEA